MATVSTDKALTQPDNAKLRAGLYLVPTPIGNLGDITLRAADVLRRADAVLCEDTRVTGGLLHHMGIKQKLHSFTDHSDATQIARILHEIQNGKALALVSDAGTPLISDPGAALVQAAIAAGITITPLPGANAILPSLQLAGFTPAPFLFLGFLPPKSAARQDAIAPYRSVAATLVLYESPSRVAACVTDLHAVLGARPVALCRELTKMYEETRRFNLGDPLDLSDVKGECVLVIAPPVITATPEHDLDTVLHGLLASEKLARAVEKATALTGLPRNQVYARALELKNAQSS